MQKFERFYANFYDQSSGSPTLFKTETAARDAAEATGPYTKPTQIAIPVTIVYREEPKLTYKQLETAYRQIKEAYDALDLAYNQTIGKKFRIVHVRSNETVASDFNSIQEAFQYIDGNQKSKDCFRIESMP